MEELKLKRTIYGFFQEFKGSLPLLHLDTIDALLNLQCFHPCQILSVEKNLFSCTRSNLDFSSEPDFEISFFSKFPIFSHSGCMYFAVVPPPFVYNPLNKVISGFFMHIHRHTQFKLLHSSLQPIILTKCLSNL